MESVKAYHGDVSIGNIFTRQQLRSGNQNEPRGWLGDFDCAYVEALPHASDSSIPPLPREDDALTVRIYSHPQRQNAEYASRGPYHLCRKLFTTL